MNEVKAKTHKITLLDTLREDLPVRQLIEAKLLDSGELVMESYKVGPGVRDALGDSDFEFDLGVASADVPSVLLELIRDQFGYPLELERWLIGKKIPYRVLTLY